MEKRLLSNMVDEVAERNPDQTFCLHPAGPGTAQTWKKFSFRELAIAVNQLSWYIDEHTKESSNQESLAYIGVNDVRYAVFLIACAKVDKVVCIFLSRALMWRCDYEVWLTVT